MLSITKHAHKRMKERMGLPKSSHEKIAKTALEKGLTHTDVKGKLRKYFDRLFLQYRPANNLRCYGEFEFSPWEDDDEEL